MISRFALIILAIFTLSLTGCVRDIENDSILTLSGFINPPSDNEVEASDFYILGYISYTPATESGEELERSIKSFGLFNTPIRLKLSPDFHYEVDIPLKDRRSKVKTFTSIKVESIRLKKVTGNVEYFFPISFDNEGVQTNSQPGTYQVKALDIDI